MRELVLNETRDGIAVLTLNRPKKLNALNYALIDRLLALLDAVEVDASVRAVILTGAGERAFSAGGDIHEFSQSVAGGADLALRDFVMRGQRLTARLEAFRKPVIAAVNGLAFGGGCEITEAVPLAIASERALFAKPEIRLAMPPTFGGTQRLPRLAGRKRALELLLTGDAFSPARALELGLVNQVVPHGELMPAARDLARRIIVHSQAALASILTAVRAASTRALRRAYWSKPNNSPAWPRPPICARGSTPGSSAACPPVTAPGRTSPGRTRQGVPRGGWTGWGRVVPHGRSGRSGNSWPRSRPGWPPAGRRTKPRPPLSPCRVLLHRGRWQSRPDGRLDQSQGRRHCGPRVAIR